MKPARSRASVRQSRIIRTLGTGRWEHGGCVGPIYHARTVQYATREAEDWLLARYEGKERPVVLMRGGSAVSMTVHLRQEIDHAEARLEEHAGCGCYRERERRAVLAVCELARSLLNELEAVARLTA